MGQRLARGTNPDLFNPAYLAMLPTVDAGDAGGGGTDGAEGGAGTDGSAGSGTEGDASGAAADDKSKPTGSTYTQEEYDNLKTRMQAADRAKSEADAKLRAIEDKDKSELEKAQRSLEEVTKERDALKTQVSDLRIHNAFLASNTFQWQNPETALKLANLSEVTIDDDGKVLNLDKALDALSKSDPYLLKPEGDKGESDEADRGASGASVGSNGGSTKDDKARRAKLEDKYPALRR